LKVTKEKEENRQAYLDIEIDAEELAKSMDTAYRTLVKKAAVPGFRKGKAPRDVLERYVGQHAMLDEALNDLVPKTVAEALKEQKIETIDRPQVEVIEVDPVKLKVIAPLPPIVEVGDYKQIRMTPEPVEVKDEDYDNVIQELRRQQATWEPVERAAAENDLVVFDIESNVEGEDYINQQGVQYQIQKDSKNPVDGFAEQIVGMNKDEVKEFALTLPEDFPKVGWGGKEVSFKITLSEVKEETLPEANDEFAVQVGEGFANMADLESKVKENILTGAQQKAKQEFEDKLVGAILEISNIEIPPVMVETELDAMIKDQMQRMGLNEDALESYLKSVGKTDEVMKEEIRPAAEKRIKSNLVLGKIYQAENLEITKEDVDDEIDIMVKDTQTENKDELRHFLSYNNSRQQIRQLLLIKKTVERLAVIASGEASAEEPAEKKEVTDEQSE